MNETKILIEKITEGIQEKKGKKHRYSRPDKYWRYNMQIFSNLSR